MDDLKLSVQEQEAMLNTQMGSITDYKDLELLDRLIASSVLPAHIKTVNHAIAVRQMGAELGMPFMQAAHHLYPVNGRLTLSVQGMQALLRKAGIKWVTTSDAREVYLTDAEGKFKPDANGNKQLSNVITSIKFIRDGLEEVASFTLRDAKVAGLLSKDVWIKYRNQMLWNRAFAIGARRIAADCLLGMGYTPEELSKNDYQIQAVDIVDDSTKVIVGDDEIEEAEIVPPTTE